ncbi:MAG: acyl-[acyl-carrier-protein]--UDP-N-acetylglucosamine O-acyltransferase [Ignavibacteriales bacterium CG_4_9_14_3_um_filter_30_11]|nr:MAG: acyl-[acyl-carrier-protein]--UDP-N-acetylglucosamine O-acyltransferase [Ignavibacteriales bacterium CG_4_9_14_3_um_filter_30_11]
MSIHPTAIVSSKAKLGKNIQISAYAIVEDNVEIGDDCFIGPYAVIYDGARIGNRVVIHQAASIAHIPQDLKFNNEESFFYVGDDTKIYEYVTLHRGTKETGFSCIGKNCLLMAYSHVAHDSTLGDNCILANGVQVAGHVEIDEYVIIGGLTPVHQFCKVGKHSMIGGGFRITQDVPPFILAANEPLKYKGLNLLGLRRRGFSNDDISVLKKAYQYIYSPLLNITQAKEKILNEFSNNKTVNEILKFLDRSSRGLIGK